jgi:hypothetical protein
MVNRHNINNITIKHLQFIQNIITRMATNSLLIKGLAIAVFSALLALFFVKDSKQPVYILIKIISILLLLYLDVYYLYQERIFRDIYNKVALKMLIGL